MDKIFSTCIDESLIQQIGILADELSTSKKAIIEAAIKLYFKQAGLGHEIDPFENTCGAWKRSETPQENILIARSAFNKSMERHHK